MNTIFKICTAMLLLVMVACGGSDDGGNPAPEPVDVVPGALNVATVIPANNQICTLSRSIGGQAEIDFSFSPIVGANRYEVRVNNQIVYNGSGTQFTAKVNFASQGSWRISAISIDDVVTVQPELFFTVPVEPSTNRSPQPIDVATMQYDQENKILSWDPVTDPDGDPIAYTFMVKVDNLLVNRFPGLEDPITTSSVVVSLDAGVDYEIVVVVNDGTFRRFASPFFYYIL